MGRKKKKQAKPWCWYPLFDVSIPIDIITLIAFIA